MLNTVRNAWKVPELRKKMIFTLFIVIVFRIGSVIPVPFLDVSALKRLITAQTGQGSVFDYLNMLSGGAFEHATLFALSIGPYITASIIIQLLTVVFPRLERMAKEGEEGRKKMGTITRYTTVALGLLQGTAFYTYLRNKQRVVMYREGWEGWFTAVIIVMVLTAGTALIMWMGEQINQKGVGNGISIILFAGIVARMPIMVSTLWQYLKTAIEAPEVASKYFVFVPLFVVLFLAVMWAIVFMNDSERRISVQYAKRVVGRKMYGGQSTHIPVKVSGSGVMPIIFASSILSMPGLIDQFAGNNSPAFLKSIASAFSYEGWLYPTLYFLLIIMFAYFYLSIQYNPMEMANNLRQSSGTIPGLRPGKPTSDFIAKVLNRVTLIGALFLAFISILPFAYGAIADMKNMIFLGGTSTIIMVGVALETMKQLESQMMMRHYKGFLG